MNYKTKRNQYLSEEGLSHISNRNTIDLPKNFNEIKTLIGPNNSLKTKINQDIMNTPENFMGDMDDIEEISEFIDDNSKFVYTSDEESPKKDNLNGIY